MRRCRIELLFFTRRARQIGPAAPNFRIPRRPVMPFHFQVDKVPLHCFRDLDVCNLYP